LTRFWMDLAASAAGTALLALIAVLLVMLLFRPAIQWLTGQVLRVLMSDRYVENLAEILPALMRMKPHLMLENSLRASSGKLIERPFGSPRRFPNFDQLVFSPAQLHPFPQEVDAAVDIRLTIGPRAKKPLRIDMPLLVGGMGFGVGLSDKMRQAIMIGASQAGTAVNTGLGPVLPEEREHAKHLIVQFHTASWARLPETLQRADAVEIRLGQGSHAGYGFVLPARDIAGRAQALMRIPEGKDAVIPSRHRELYTPQDLARLVQYLRDTTAGVPIGVKMCAGSQLERDLEQAVSAGVDFISLDGGNAATKSAPPILQDDFGMPTIYALCRAVRFLEECGVKDDVTLLVGGGFFTPGDCLKAIALGADGVYLGTSVLWATTHTQVAKAVPWEPPTQLVYYSGKLKGHFDEDRAAAHLHMFLASMAEEMKTGIRALGKNALDDIGLDDLMALDEWTAYVTGAPPGYPVR
jgi:Glutamate synthase domain 2